MALSKLIDALPAHAADVKANLATLIEEDTLTKDQLYGTFMATALAGRNAMVIREVEEECRQHLDAEILDGAKAAHAIMAQNNMYYKFYGMVSDDAYRAMPAGLAMNVVRDPGVDKQDFELWSLAVSVINSCKYCVDVHDRKLKRGGMENEQIWTAVRIAAVMHAVSAVLGGEDALA